jgi:hypothetical protein
MQPILIHRTNGLTVVYWPETGELNVLAHHEALALVESMALCQCAAEARETG